MKLAIASGKGGTGKTTIATNLAAVAASHGASTSYVDCDVEEPNGHIFLRPRIKETKPIEVFIPSVDKETCIACGQCQEICQYSAIILMGEEVLVYPDLCHSCGGCMLVCPVNAISETPRTMGVIEMGDTDAGVNFIQGRLNIGEKQSPPAIRSVKKHLPENGLQILDAPPGTACPVIEVVSGADYTILVTEPTPFGLNDLILAVEMMRALKKPFGVAVNQADIGDDEVSRYLRREKLDKLLELPHDRRIAEVYSNGHLIVENLPEYKTLFENLLNSALAECENIIKT